MLDTATPTSAPTAAPALAARAVTRVYGDGDAAVHALRGFTPALPAGAFTAIMGPSGSGKSTLMHLLAGLDRPTDGTVHIGGEDIGAMSDAQLTKLRRRHVGFVFQAFNLLPVLSAEENVTLPLSIAGRKVDQAALDALMQRMGRDDGRPRAVPRRRAHRRRHGEADRGADPRADEGARLMLRLTLRGLAARPLRTALTTLAIVLGVALVSGALTLTDTQRRAADALSSASYDGTDAVVSTRTAFEVDSSDDWAIQRPTIPASNLETVRAVPEVGVAVGDV